VIVVSDTSAITNLLAIRRETLLLQLFGVVLVPAAVQAELSVTHLQIPAFLQIRVVEDRAAVRQFIDADLDLGEAEAIQLALELDADHLLIDEAAGRRIAEQRGLKIIGVLGVLAQAKRNGLITAVLPEIDALRSAADFWIAPALRVRFLRDLGEA